MGEVIDEIVDGKNIQPNQKTIDKKDFFDFRLGDSRLIAFLELELLYYKRTYTHLDIKTEHKKLAKYEKHLKINNYWNGELKDLVKKMKPWITQM